MKFKVGQEWRTRAGALVTIEEIVGPDGFGYPVFGDDGVSRNAAGRVFNAATNGFDLVELIEDAKPLVKGMRWPSGFDGAHHTGGADAT